MQSFRNTTEAAIERIDGAIDAIQKDIKEIFLRLPPPNTTNSESPIKLTSLGQEISAELDARDWAQEAAGVIALKLTHPLPPEIQRRAFEYADEESNYAPVLQTNIDMTAYTHGIEVEKVRRVFGVELRNALLKKFNLPVPP